jgi:hypothetical protein
LASLVPGLSMVELEGLTLLKANNRAGYFGVHRSSAGFQARVRRGGNVACLGRFATAEEAALCVARSPEGQAAAKKAAAASVPLTSEEARKQAKAEGLTLLVADNKTGFFCVSLDKPGRSKHCQARVRRGGKDVSLGCFVTAEEAALCIARSPEGRAAVRAAEAAAPPLTSEEALQQAKAEGLMLRRAKNKAGYLGVSLNQSCKIKPYQAQVSRGCKLVYLGRFVTAEEAALCIARTPEGRLATKRAATLPAAVAPPSPSSSAADGLKLLMAAAGQRMSEAESAGTRIEEKQEGDVQRAAVVNEEERDSGRRKRPRGSDTATVKTAKVTTHFKRDRQYFADTRGL